VVEDDTDTRELVAAVLAQRGAQVTGAASAAEALAALDRAVPDVLVSDIGMPGQNGYDFVRQVRLRPSSQGGLVPALALTAYTAAPDRQEASAAGFQDYLAKPAEPAELVAKVAGLASRRP
jgi:CheY-like chemotaxis protein